MRLGKFLGAVLQKAFLQSAGSWGASITLDKNGNIVDELEERRQIVKVRKKQSTAGRQNIEKEYAQ